MDPQLSSELIPYHQPKLHNTHTDIHTWNGVTETVCNLLKDMLSTAVLPASRVNTQSGTYDGAFMMMMM